VHLYHEVFAPQSPNETLNWRPSLNQEKEKKITYHHKQAKEVNEFPEQGKGQALEVEECFLTL
jgi:hypothetical protein